MFVHSVVFWLKKDLTAREIRHFEEEVDKLIAIETVVHGWLGKPARTDREIIDRSYDYLLTIVNDNYDDQMAYQVDPIHDKFRDTCEKYFDKVKIYDAEGLDESGNP